MAFVQQLGNTFLFSVTEKHKGTRNFDKLKPTNVYDIYTWFHTRNVCKNTYHVENLSGSMAANLLGSASSFYRTCGIFFNISDFCPGQRNFRESGPVHWGQPDCVLGADAKKSSPPGSYLLYKEGGGGGKGGAKSLYGYRRKGREGS